MKKINLTLFAVLVAVVISSCGKNENQFDATGSFEAVETIISAEAQGVIKEFSLEEGQTLKANTEIGYIDSVQLSLKKNQLEAQINAVLSRKPNVSLQLASLQEQLKTAEREQERVSNLVKADAATTKQLDDVNAQVQVLKRQLSALKSNLDITISSIKSETAPLEIQIEQIKDLIQKSKIVNPITGTVLTKYAEKNEMAAPGKPLYKIADVSSLILRVYISGNQLPQVKLNQTVTVRTDNGEGGFDETKGVITWISTKAEFTPKTIQTKEERANRVYAVKVSVKNEGNLKIGMYGEIKF